MLNTAEYDAAEQLVSLSQLSLEDTAQAEAGDQQPPAAPSEQQAQAAEPADAAAGGQQEQQQGSSPAKRAAAAAAGKGEPEPALQTGTVATN